MKKTYTLLLLLAFSASLSSGVSPGRQRSMTAKTDGSVSVRNQDDIWAVVEYPEGQEVTIELVSSTLVPSAKGTARVTRSSSGAEINLELSGLTTDIESYHAYAIDSLGNASALGTLSVNDGAGTLRTQTALTRFMLLISSKENVVTLATDTPIVLRSKAPEGLKIIPKVTAPENAAEETARSNEPETSLMSDYDVPLLSIESLKRGVSSQMKARLFEEVQGSSVNASVTPRAKGTTQIKFLFRDLKPAPDGWHYIVWVVSADKAYSVLGKALPGRQTKLDSATSLGDFGIFITREDSDSPLLPTGKMVAMIVR